ncbi:MAG: NtrZ family periplasmic regulatory protein [Asticcacaulis sp.]|uniref:NtrZ family periplasmic regulatory protein n=1 Tax=Asticcacaulis tiandongensis TaxID=2565365 RepID=UPI001FE5B6CE|nr:hypothetical protein [Asticcacaulis tiandongensis]
MKKIVSLIAPVAALAIAGSALPAYAQSNKTTRATEASSPAAALSLTTGAGTQKDSGNASPTNKIYQWSLKGRWGLKLDVTEEESRPSGWNDVDAGAFYKISPSVRVGGTVGFGEKTKGLQPKDPVGEEKQPRVRLETTFKF